MKKDILVYIEWEDAIASHEWFSVEEANSWARDTSLTIKQVGWIYEETKEYIALYSRKSLWTSNRGERGLLQKIPKTWVRKKIRIKL